MPAFSAVGVRYASILYLDAGTRHLAFPPATRKSQSCSGLCKAPKRRHAIPQIAIGSTDSTGLDLTLEIDVSFVFLPSGLMTSDGELPLTCALLVVGPLRCTPLVVDPLRCVPLVIDLLTPTLFGVVPLIVADFVVRMCPSLTRKNPRRNKWTSNDDNLHTRAKFFSDTQLDVEMEWRVWGECGKRVAFYMNAWDINPSDMNAWDINPSDDFAISLFPHSLFNDAAAIASHCMYLRLLEISRRRTARLPQDSGTRFLHSQQLTVAIVPMSSW